MRAVALADSWTAASASPKPWTPLVQTRTGNIRQGNKEIMVLLANSA